MPRKLTDKQAAFVQEYLVDLNARQAAIRAGYSAKTADAIATQLLSKTLVAQAISEAKAARAEVVTRTAADVLRDIIAVTEEARQQGERKTALKGLELQGKHIGMFTDRVDHTSSDGSMAGPLNVTVQYVCAKVQGKE